MDIPNAALGVLYYSCILLYQLSILPHFVSLDLIFGMCCMAMISSIFLALKLLALRELCLVCWTTHVLNASLLVVNGGKLFSMRTNIKTA